MFRQLPLHHCIASFIIYNYDTTCVFSESRWCQNNEICVEITMQASPFCNWVSVLYTTMWWDCHNVMKYVFSLALFPTLMDNYGQQDQGGVKIGKMTDAMSQSKPWPFAQVCDIDPYFETRLCRCHWCATLKGKWERDSKCEQKKLKSPICLCLLSAPLLLYLCFFILMLRYYYIVLNYSNSIGKEQYIN